MIFSASYVPRGGVQVLFEHQKQPSPTLGSGLPWVLLTNHSTLMLFQIIEKIKRIENLNHTILYHLVAKPWKKENNKIVICKAIHLEVIFQKKINYFLNKLNSTLEF
jgi:hypothetical protein